MLSLEKAAFGKYSLREWVEDGPGDCPATPPVPPVPGLFNYRHLAVVAGPTGRSRCGWTPCIDWIPARAKGDISPRHGPAGGADRNEKRGRDG